MSKKKKPQTLLGLLEQALVSEDNQPYEIPRNWIWTSLDYIAFLTDFVANGSFKSLKDNVTVYDDDEFSYFVRLYDLRRGIGHVGQKYVDEKSYKFLSKSLLIGEEILLSSVGSVGTVYLMPNVDKPATIAPNMIVCKINEHLNNYYAYYYFKSPFGQEFIESITAGTTQSKINKTNLKTVILPLPPLKEQKRIVDTINYLFSKIDEAQSLIEETKETFELRRAAILDMAFRGELTRKWRKEKNLDYNWSIVKLEELISNGPQNGLYKPQHSYGEGTLIVRIDNFYNGSINDWSTLKRLKLEDKELALYKILNGDILINRVNSIEYLGKSALVRNLQEDCVFESNIMKFTPREEVNKEYLIMYLNSNSGLQELRKNAKHAVNQASINQTDVKNTLVPLPPLEEQNEIIRIVLKLLETHTNAETIIDEQFFLLETYKQSILAKAFRGELGTNDSNDEHAIELLKLILEEKIS